MTNTLQTLTAQFITDNQDVVDGFENKWNTQDYDHRIEEFAKEQTKAKFEVSDDELEDIMEEDTYDNEVYAFHRALEDDLFHELWDLGQAYERKWTVIKELTQKFLDTNTSQVSVDRVPVRFFTSLEMKIGLFTEEQARLRYRLNEVEMASLIKGKAEEDVIEFCEKLKDNIFNEVYTLAQSDSAQQHFDIHG